MELRCSAAAQQQLTSIQSQLLAARQAAKIPQQKLSDVLGVASRTLRDWEKCVDSPNLKHLINWAYALGFRLVIVDPLGSPALPPIELEDGETFELHEIRRLALPLWTRRRARKLSRLDLSLLIGVSRTAVQRWEDAEKPPRPLSLIAWANRLGCSIGLGRCTTEDETPEKPDKAAA